MADILSKEECKSFCCQTQRHTNETTDSENKMYKMRNYMQQVLIDAGRARECV